MRDYTISPRRSTLDAIWAISIKEAPILRSLLFVPSRLCFIKILTCTLVGMAPLGTGCSGGGISASPAKSAFTGRYQGSFDMSEVKVGGVFPIAAHSVDLSFTLSQADADIKGMGSATNLLGDLAALAFISGPQRGEIKGMVVDGIAELSLDIPPFGAPPAPASIVFVGKVTDDGLVGKCRSNLAGSESTPAPCTLARVTLTDEGEGGAAE